MFMIHIIIKRNIWILNKKFLSLHNVKPINRIIMETYKLQANEKHFELGMSIIKDGGYYLWNDVGEKYQIINHKLIPLTVRGYALLKEIVSSEWFKKNVIFKLN